MRTLLDIDIEDFKMSEYGIVYFSEKGFEMFVSNITNLKLRTILTFYPSLLGSIQNSNPSGLASNRIDNEHFLFAYALTLKNPIAKDTRLINHTSTVVNFVVTRDQYKLLMIAFDEFEKYLDKMFSEIVYLDELYEINFSDIVFKFVKGIGNTPFLIGERKKECVSKPDIPSLATEFKKWFNELEFSIEQE